MEVDVEVAVEAEAEEEVVWRRLRWRCGASCEVEVWCAMQEAAAKHAERRGSVGEGRGACPS